MLSHFSFLHAKLRTATLRHNIEAQATLQNLLLRNYLHYNLYDQADKLVAKSTFPEQASNHEWARFLYYLGKEVKHCWISCLKKWKKKNENQLVILFVYPEYISVIYILELKCIICLKEWISNISLMQFKINFFMRKIKLNLALKSHFMAVSENMMYQIFKECVIPWIIERFFSWILNF